MMPMEKKKIGEIDEFIYGFYLRGVCWGVQCLVIYQLVAVAVWAVEMEQVQLVELENLF